MLKYGFARRVPPYRMTYWLRGSCHMIHGSPHPGLHRQRREKESEDYSCTAQRRMRRIGSWSNPPHGTYRRSQLLWHTMCSNMHTSTFVPHMCLFFICHCASRRIVLSFDKCSTIDIKEKKVNMQRISVAFERPTSGI
jgi:hypothetical protein